MSICHPLNTQIPTQQQGIDADKCPFAEILLCYSAPRALFEHSKSKFTSKDVQT